MSGTSTSTARAGLDIDHASEILDLDTLEAHGLPLGSAQRTRRQAVG